MNDFLPVTPEEMRQRGWKQLDVILITGDAYVDHPSYGTAVIGRVLEAAGYKVGIIPQPDWRSTEDFTRLGRPRLFFGISAGNLDSMVANYTSNRNRRKEDDYSPGGRAGLRPDRAIIVYANKVREAFENALIVIGGIEASLRRLAHYDWWDNTVRRSILLDSRADILVYGMGERQIREIARRVACGLDLDGIPGTAIVRARSDMFSRSTVLPSYEAVKHDPYSFNEAFVTTYRNQNHFKGKTLLQPHGNRTVVQFPPAEPLSTAELDAIYDLPFQRNPHPIYVRQGGIPGFETVRFSITSHRGCCGECSFCSLFMHQGRVVQSRSKESVLREARLLAQSSDFKGTITDVGGPTANLYMVQCSKWLTKGVCSQKHCLTPKKCVNLRLGYREGVALLKEIKKIPKVNHVFLESGLRYDLLLEAEGLAYLEYVCRHHVGGRLKVAPEHNAPRVLRLMNKPDFSVYESFSRLFRETNRKIGKDQYLVNYFISAHPGCTLEDSLQLALYLAKRGMKVEQIQDYMPLPMTLSGCMYHTEKETVTGRKIHVAKSHHERRLHRSLMQYGNPSNEKFLREALQSLGKESFLPIFQKKASRHRKNDL